jgi:hypothetical protein
VGILIDFYIPRKSRKGYVLIAMGIYATTYLTLKCLMAAYYHFRFYIGKTCCACVHPKDDDQYRRERLNQFWQGIQRPLGA